MLQELLPFEGPCIKHKKNLIYNNKISPKILFFDNSCTSTLTWCSVYIHECMYVLLPVGLHLLETCHAIHEHVFMKEGKNKIDF